jgi:hypothetical protein
MYILNKIFLRGGIKLEKGREVVGFLIIHIIPLYCLKSATSPLKTIGNKKIRKGGRKKTSLEERMCYENEENYII